MLTREVAWDCEVWSFGRVDGSGSLIQSSLINSCWQIWFTQLLDQNDFLRNLPTFKCWLKKECMKLGFASASTLLFIRLWCPNKHFPNVFFLNQRIGSFFWHIACSDIHLTKYSGAMKNKCGWWLSTFKTTDRKRQT